MKVIFCRTSSYFCAHFGPSAAPHQAATTPHYTPPFAAATNAVAAAAITKHYYFYILGIYSKEARV